MNEIELTEQFQTDAALIKRLKEENEELRDKLIGVVRLIGPSPQAVVKQMELEKQLQQANEDAERLYKSLYHLIFVADYDKTCSRCRDIKNNLKAHEERIKG